MIKAVLLDLDNTLIHNPDRAFATAFLHHFDIFFEARTQQKHLAKHLIAGVKAQNETRAPQDTNFQVMINAVLGQLTLGESELRNTIRDFYDEAYPSLKDCVQPVSGATDLVHHLIEEGYAVVIATNPLYPLDAVKQRLSWGNLPTDDATYALITHYDNMHFSKPDPAYYAEILARVGIEPDEALVVGDSETNDTFPAHQLGLHTYHVTSEHNHTIQTLLEQITKHHWLETLMERRLQPKMITPQYRGNVGAMYGLLDTVQSHYWKQQPDPQEWSIIQILCHLAESEHEVQRPRLQRILAEDNPFLVAPRTPMGPEMPLCDSDGMRVAGDFAAERSTTLEFIHALDDSAWHRIARHSIFGPTTLLEMAHFTAQHDRMHLNQLCQTIGHCA